MAPADALSINGFACNAAYYAPRIKTAVARVLACSVANVFAGAIDAQTPGVSYACSDTLVVTGYGTVSIPVATSPALHAWTSSACCHVRLL